MSENKTMRAVLLDLAREKDTLESIFEFFDLVHKYGFNTVNLYLEDRITTKTYPYRSPAENYSEDEIREIVEEYMEDHPGGSVSGECATDEEVLALLKDTV